MNLNQQTMKLQTYIQNHQDISNITEKNISQIYQELIDCLTDHNHRYYIQNNPIISDNEYDLLFSYLKQIEYNFPHLISSNSPTQELIWQIADGFEQADHKVPLLSLENSYDTQDIMNRWDFVTRTYTKNIESTQEIEYTLEPKFDGISVEIIYKNWKFYQAITRGDGQTGDDITTNTKMIKNIPITIPDTQELHVRGEVMMPISQWKKINEQREKEWKNTFANTRNATGWTIKLLDSNEVKNRGLICYIYDVLYSSKEPKTDQEQNRKYLNTLWLPIHPRFKKSKNIQEIANICTDESIKKQLEQEDFEIDWLVIKINQTIIRETLGSTEHHPRRAIAYKFPAQQISTQIESVDFQVWRTGIITPVANLTPVQISWVTIKRVSLHNQDFIDNKNIHINDYVRIQRSGEVIPYIVWVIQSRRPNSTKPIQSPIQCPVCQTPTTKIDMHTYCSNPSCPAQLKERIEHFVSKPCMNIEWIGESIVDILVEHDIVHNVADLYTLTNPKTQITLRRFPGFADKKVYEITQQLEKSKSQPLRRLIHALSIPNIGKKIAMSIQQAIQTEHEQEKATAEILTKYLTNTEFLNNIYGIGDKIVQWLVEFIADPKNMQLIQELEQHWLNFSLSEKTKTPQSLFIGKHFCITGTFPIPRDRIIQACEQEWMVFDNSPTQKTDILFAWEKAWSKASKAQGMFIPILSNREEIKKQYSFLQKIPQSQKSDWPQAQSLF